MKAELYRMVTDEHICPFGIKSKNLLENEGFEIEDIHLSTRKEADEFKKKYDVETTPQTFIKNERIGGYEDLVNHFGKSTLKQEGKTYQPIIAVFASTLLMSFAFTFSLYSKFMLVSVIENFIALSMFVLAILKLRDLYSFTNQFITYDILGKRFIPYSYIYPFGELFAALGMITGILPLWVSAISITIGTIGSISVVKAVYIDKRDIKCACVGGDSNVPLGLISLAENIMMVAMGSWLVSKFI